MIELIVAIMLSALGVLLLFLGYLLLVKQKISIMHDYHYTNVKENDKKAYTRVMGIALLIMGVGFAISGILSFFDTSIQSSIPYIASTIVGIIIMVYGQIKYNHGIF